MKKIRPKHGPEYKIQRDVIEYLRQRGWWVERMIGNAFQKGIPDLLVAHPKFGTRFIDVKNPVSYSFTKAQIQKWPIFDRYGIGVWIITAATDEEYDKLFKPPNWKDFWKPRYDEYLMDIDVLLAELIKEEKEDTPKPLKLTKPLDTNWLDNWKKDADENTDR